MIHHCISSGLGRPTRPLPFAAEADLRWMCSLAVRPKIVKGQIFVALLIMMGCGLLCQGGIQAKHGNSSDRSDHVDPEFLVLRIKSGQLISHQLWNSWNICCVLGSAVQEFSYPVHMSSLFQHAQIINNLVVLGELNIFKHFPGNHLWPFHSFAKRL